MFPHIFYTNGIGVTSLHVSEPFKLSQYALCFYGDAPYIDTFGNLINSFAQHGITNKIIEDSKVYSNYKLTSHYQQNEEKVGPEVLTMNHMEIAFIFSLLPLLLGFLAFLSELLMFRIEKKLEKRREKKESGD